MEENTKCYHARRNGRSHWRDGSSALVVYHGRLLNGSKLEVADGLAFLRTLNTKLFAFSFLSCVSMGSDRDNSFSA
jgi:hypothetical protein